jgi:hypothetical protein
MISAASAQPQGRIMPWKWQRKGRVALLFCKKEAKNFPSLRHGHLTRHGFKRTKFICFIFVYKKKILLTSLSSFHAEFAAMQQHCYHVLIDPEEKPWMS